MITAGPNGTACPGSKLPFSPGFNAGVSNTGAGEYSPFTLNLEKPDGQQQIQSIATSCPPGMAANIASVTVDARPRSKRCRCPTRMHRPAAPKAKSGQRPAPAGLGSQAVVLGGKLYFTKGDRRCPFGLLASTDAIGRAIPHRLGQRPRDDHGQRRHTAAVTTKTVTPVPKTIDGVPVQLKQINVSVNRPGTSSSTRRTARRPCVTGRWAAGKKAARGALLPASTSRTAPTSAFKPDFKAYTEGHTSKEGGASLRVRITYPPGAYANIGKSVTYLPYDLPSRLKPTIQHACPDYDFQPQHAADVRPAVAGRPRRSSTRRYSRTRLKGPPTSSRTPTARSPTWTSSSTNRKAA